MAYRVQRKDKSIGQQDGQIISWLLLWFVFIWLLFLHLAFFENVCIKQDKII